VNKTKRRRSFLQHRKAIQFTLLAKKYQKKKFSLNLTASSCARST
jgi:hypothetical protein